MDEDVLISSLSPEELEELLKAIEDEEGGDEQNSKKGQNKHD